jgi:hypothetical protein
MDYVAALVAFISNHYPSSIIKLVDLLAEDILLSLENNNFTHR